jgi:hypothetical protein
MATTGVAAEASSHSRSWTLDTRPGRVGAGVNFDSTIGNDGAAEIGLHGRTAMVGWLGIMASLPGSYCWQIRWLEVREWDGRALQTPRWGHQTVERSYNLPTRQASP